MKVTAKGQITIPQDIRLRFGLLPDTDVEFVVDGNTVRLKKARGGGRGGVLVARLKGRARGGLSTDQIMALTRSER